MSTRPPVQPSAAPADFRSGAERRSPYPKGRMRRLGHRIDRLIEAATYGPIDEVVRETHTREASAIAAELAAIFAPQPVHPPLWQQGGKAIW